jgi:ribosomal protein S27AE
MSFAEMEILSHQIGRRVAQQLGHQMTSLQAELYSDDYWCPTCGLDCEATYRTRTIHAINGETAVVELKSFCPKCRRSFFPCS